MEPQQEPHDDLEDSRESSPEEEEATVKKHQPHHHGATTTTTDPPNNNNGPSPPSSSSSPLSPTTTDTSTTTTAPYNLNEDDCKDPGIPPSISQAAAEDVNDLKHNSDIDETEMIEPESPGNSMWQYGHHVGADSNIRPFTLIQKRSIDYVRRLSFTGSFGNMSPINVFSFRKETSSLSTPSPYRSPSPPPCCDCCDTVFGVKKGPKIHC